MSQTPLSDYLLSMSSLALILFVFGVLYLLLEFGFRTGRRFRTRSGEHGAEFVQQGLMTLLSLLLAFSVSIAEVRYEGRSETLITEANVISTAYLRVDLLPREEQKSLKELLKKYLELRIDYYTIQRGTQQDRLQVVLRETETLQNKIWSQGVASGEGVPPVFLTQLLSSLNQMFDLQAKQDYAYSQVVPRSIMLLLLFTSCVVSGMAGFNHGKSNNRHFIFSSILLVVITLTLFVIVDLDRPHRGFIRLNPKPLIALREKLV